MGVRRANQLVMSVPRDKKREFRQAMKGLPATDPDIARIAVEVSAEMRAISVAVWVLMAICIAFFGYIWIQTGSVGSSFFVVLGFANIGLWVFMRRRAARVIRVNGLVLPPGEG